ncbi:hypothetical protein PG994_012732 [Apiospora phragmitis]|uniref:Tricarboxylate transport protein n=1 Tax=Apiospora phragmitis TaxID=2905665 RepID=A0ABR1TDP1_9PEZI
MVADANSRTSPLISLLAGGTAGGIEAFCTYPFEFAKTRVQLYGHEGVKNPFRVVGNVIQREGLPALYKGCSTMIVGSIGKDAVRFVAFDSIRKMFEDPVTHTLGPAQSIASGMVAGVVSSTVIVTPTERIKTALIDDAKTSRRFRSPWHCLATLTKEQGALRALYAGYVTTTLKQIGTTGFRLGSYSILKDWERRSAWFADKEKGVPRIDIDGPVVSFANGALAGTITTLATQPFDTVKTKVQQARAVGGTLDAARAIVAEDGVFRGFWRGTVMRLGRTVMAGGILFTANEQATKVWRMVLGQ